MIGYGGLALGCIVAGAAAFLVVAAPIELVRDRVIERVKVRSGLDLTVAGGASLSFFPRAGLAFADVSLAAPGDGATPILTAARLEADVSLWSLFGGHPAVHRLTVYAPLIDLDADVLDRPRARLRPDRETAVTGPAEAPQAGMASEAVPVHVPGPEVARRLSRLGAGTLNVVDGTIRYRGRGGDQVEATSVQLTLSAEAPSAPLSLTGSASVRDTPVAISGTIAPEDASATEQTARAALKLSGPLFSAAYEGTLTLAGGLALDGTVQLESGSIEALSAWFGHPRPAAGADDALALTAGLKASGDRISLAKLNGKIGSTVLSGALAVDWSGPRRRLTGTLETSELDFGRLLLRQPSRARRAATPAATPSAERMPPPRPAASEPPASRAADRREGRDWSDDPINLSLLGLADVDLKLVAGRVVYKHLNTGPSRLTVRLEGGAGNVWLEEIQLYGGRALGQLTLDATGDVLVAGVNVRLDRVDLQPLLVDALDVPWLEGRASLDVALAGQGATERQIVEGLNGKVELTSRDGAIAGADVGKIVRGIQNMRLPRLSLSPSEKTPYSELAGTFAVTNGVAGNKDLHLTGPHVQLNGEGTLDLSQRRIDYTMRTKVGAAPDADARLKVGEIEVPVTITGPWYKPDFGIKGQEQLTGTIRQIGRNLRSREVKDALRGLLQGDGEKRVKPRDILDQLLKKD